MKQLQNKIRFVVSPEGHLVYDPSGKAISAKEIMVSLDVLKEKVQSEKLFSENALPVDKTFEKRFLMQLESQFSSGLSLAKKAGILVIGLKNVLDALKNKDVDVVLLAENAGKDVRHKLKAFEQQSSCLLHTNVYDGALGTVNTVVVAINKAKMPTPLCVAIDVLKEMR